MTDATPPPLTFAALDAAIEALPEGPVSVLRSPRWTRYWTLGGLVGVLVGLLPSLLILWMDPAAWMVVIARTGLVLALIGFAPGLCRSVWVLFREVRRHRQGLIEQFDHDVEQFRSLASWLASYPGSSTTGSSRSGVTQALSACSSPHRTHCGSP